MFEDGKLIWIVLAGRGREWSQGEFEEEISVR
jgi:hypothetical protein